MRMMPAPRGLNQSLRIPIRMAPTQPPLETGSAAQMSLGQNRVIRPAEAGMSRPRPTTAPSETRR